MSIPGLKDWRTTIPTIITVVAGFVLFAPDLFPDTAPWGIWTKRIAAFILGGGTLAWGIQSPSSAKVIEKTNELVDKKLDQK